MEIEFYSSLFCLSPILGIWIVQAKQTNAIGIAKAKALTAFDLILPTATEGCY